MRGPITACLLHADFHVMSAECWTRTLMWLGAHDHLPAGEERSAYQAAVERVILDAVRRK